MHRLAIGGLDGQVRHVARERMANVDDVAAVVAETARAEAHDGFVGFRDAESSRRSAMASGPPATASHSTTACSSAGSSFRRSAMSCSSVDGSGLLAVVAALVRDEDRLLAFAALANLERAALEQRVDHLEQKERVPGGARHEIRAHLGDAFGRARGAPARAAPDSRRRARASSTRTTPSMSGSDAIVGARASSSVSTGIGSPRRTRLTTSSRLARSHHCRPSITTTSGASTAERANRRRTPR